MKKIAYVAALIVLVVFFYKLFEQKQGISVVDDFTKKEIKKVQEISSKNNSFEKSYLLSVKYGIKHESLLELLQEYVNLTDTAIEVPNLIVKNDKSEILPVEMSINVLSKKHNIKEGKLAHIILSLQMNINIDDYCEDYCDDLMLDRQEEYPEY